MLRYGALTDDAMKKWIPNDAGEIVAKFQSGESVLSLSIRYGAARRAIERVLREQGVAKRGHREATATWMKQKSDAERTRIVEAAHAASRGRKASIRERERVAESKQRNQSHASECEIELVRMLQKRGIAGIVPQQAAGIYNIDVGCQPVAIEVFGGGWHSEGRHRRRTETRYRYLLDNGWSVLVIWCMNSFKYISIAAANYAAAYIDAVRADPSLLGEYRIIRGDGMFIGKGRDNLDRIAWAPTSRRHIDWPAMD